MTGVVCTLIDIIAATVRSLLESSTTLTCIRTVSVNASRTTTASIGTVLTLVTVNTAQALFGVASCAIAKEGAHGVGALHFSTLARITLVTFVHIITVVAITLETVVTSTNSSGCSLTALGIRGASMSSIGTIVSCLSRNRLLWSGCWSTLE